MDWPVPFNRTPKITEYDQIGQKNKDKWQASHNPKKLYTHITTAMLLSDAALPTIENPRKLEQQYLRPSMDLRTPQIEGESGSVEIHTGLQRSAPEVQRAKEVIEGLYGEELQWGRSQEEVTRNAARKERAGNAETAGKTKGIVMWSPKALMNTAKSTAKRHAHLHVETIHMMKEQIQHRMWEEPYRNRLSPAALRDQDDEE